MPKCVGLVVKNGAWEQVGDETLAVLKAADSQHAERKKLAQIQTNPVLLVQDAFPCSKCDTFFKASGRNIIVKVEKNDGLYSLDHGLGAKPGLPVIIYYTGGTATYLHKSPPYPAVPAAFNNIPDFVSEQYY